MRRDDFKTNHPILYTIYIYIYGFIPSDPHVPLQPDLRIAQIQEPRSFNDGESRTIYCRKSIKQSHAIFVLVLVVACLTFIFCWFVGWLYRWWAFELFCRLEEVWKEIQLQGSEDEVCSTTTSMIRLAQQVVV